MDKKTWFTHSDNWNINVHEWSAFPGITHRWFRWMDIADNITTVTWFRYIWVSGIDWNQNKSSISIECSGWVEAEIFNSFYIFHTKFICIMLYIVNSNQHFGQRDLQLVFHVEQNNSIFMNSGACQCCIVHHTKE